MNSDYAYDSILSIVSKEGFSGNRLMTDNSEISELIVYDSSNSESIVFE